MTDIISVIAPINMAVIKYWGKRDEKLIIPLNDSVSGTLDPKVMCAKTSVCARSAFEEDELWLNGIKESITSERLQNCLKKIRELAIEQKSVDEEFLKFKVHICSENNFPTAAGLASSAAGYACLVTALATLYKVKTDISALARIGSGSACRSVYGGFVRWYAGSNPDGSDSIAKPVVDSSHWPDMRVLVLVIADTKKHTSSTKGMKTTVETSELMKHRIQVSVPSRIEKICEAIVKKDFPTFAELTMKDSNEFHAVCLSAFPPCIYLTNTSLKIIEMVHYYNNICGTIKVAYTFDAGPNACLYLLEEEVPKMLSVIKYFFPFSSEDFIKGLKAPPIKEFPIESHIYKSATEKDLINYIIYTKVGEGPIVLKDGPHLLNEHGKPHEKNI
ncbi:unnamed protein product [Pieris macdunnoughi]|uniref:Diphosphomevalonate decarboxylase n=1 Tax=Pieris macdunnoughi TaxID=345717 RepID=A0A821WS46_9NEOP|nr:unnamed protein product [Pieris macdunnoughi]